MWWCRGLCSLMHRPLPHHQEGTETLLSCISGRWSLTGKNENSVWRQVHWAAVVQRDHGARRSLVVKTVDRALQPATEAEDSLVKKAVGRMENHTS